MQRVGFRNWLLRYGGTVCGVAAAVEVRWALDPIVADRQPFSTFYLAAAIASILGGLGPGLLAIALSVPATSYFFLTPRGGFAVWNLSNCMAIGLYVGNSLVVAALSEAAGRARRRAIRGRAALAWEMGERAEAIQAMRRSEAMLRALADSMPQIVWAARPDGERDYYNQRWFDHTGLQESGSVAPGGWKEIWTPLLHPDDRLRYLNRWDAAFEAGAVFEVEYRLRDAARDEYRWHLGRALPVRDDRGEIVRWYGTCTDIDDRKRAEQAAEAAHQAKDRFLAVLSHELRTPLTPILLDVVALLENPRVEGEIRGTLEMVRRNVALEARLIDDLLDLTRIIQGKMTLHFEPSDAHELIGRTLEICRGDVQAAGIHLSVDLQATRHHVTADPARLQQVYWNLIKNAVKFTPTGGQLTIRSRNEGADRLVVEVADTGVGIEPEFLPRVFTPFEQGEAAYRTRKFGGLGLGLAISLSVVEAHHGQLTARSEGPGRGATFRVDLATLATPHAAPTPSPVPTCESVGLTLHILLVEDDPSTRQILARLLRRQGHEVTTADGVQNAIHAAETASHRLDLILSDIGLPDGTGLDVVRELCPRLEVPAIALSGYGTDDDIRKGQEAGFDLHLIKPIEPRALDAAIRRVAMLRS